jgi:hypothetical protein
MHGLPGFHDGLFPTSVSAAPMSGAKCGSSFVAGAVLDAPMMLPRWSRTLVCGYPCARRIKVLADAARSVAETDADEQGDVALGQQPAGGVLALERHHGRHRAGA